MHTTDEPLGSVSRGGVERTPAAVRALGWTSFLTDFSSEAIYPLLPGFVKGLGGTSVEIGLIDGIANAVAAVVRLPSGAVSDAVSPRLALVAGWLVFAAAYGGLAVTTSLPGVLALMGGVGVAYGIAEPAERALVAALAADGRHGGAFGWYALVQGLMALPAGLLAGWLWASSPHGPALSFAVTAGLSLAACGLLVAGCRR